VKDFLQNRLSTPLLDLLKRAASRQGRELYLVGGVVRDYLRNDLKDISDLDIAVDGSGIAKVAEELAVECKAEYPSIDIKLFPAFQTAKIIINGGSSSDNNEHVDLSTTRMESYPVSAGAPKVEAATIVEDLLRRDFSLNAIALQIAPLFTGTVFDPYQGKHDINNKILRVLYPQSFIDDPSRIVRGIKFAIRFGYDFEPETERLIRDVVATPQFTVFTSLSQHISLRKRFGRELLAILSQDNWKQGVALLVKYQVLGLVHPTFQDTRLVNKVVNGVMTKTYENPRECLYDLLSPLNEEDRITTSLRLGIKQVTEK